MGRPAKAIISRERAARAALDVIDVLGLGAFSLEAVAKRLGVKAPSLYHHFSDKDALLAEVARLLLIDIELPSHGPSDDPLERLISIAVAVRRSILQHANAAPLLLQFFPRHLLLSSYESSLGRDNPFPVHLRQIGLEGLDALTYGSALFAASCRSRGIEPMPNFAPEDYPKLAAAIRLNHHSEEERFIEMLRAFLRGLAIAEEGAFESSPVKKPRFADGQKGMPLTHLNRELSDRSDVAESVSPTQF